MKLVKRSERKFLDNNILNYTVIDNLTAPVPTSDGLTTGLISNSSQFATVVSAAAANILTLPLASSTPIGTMIRGIVGANGFKLQVNTVDATTVKLNNVTTNVKAVIPANVLFRVELTSATTWLLTTITSLGAFGTAIVPA